MAKKIVEVKTNADGVTTAVRFEGNTTFTPLPVAIGLAEQKKIENVHVVNPKNGEKYLRTNPDGSTGNNLDELAKD